MKIIPVIDYQQGNVVLAQMGNRDKYQPISSTLCDKPDIVSVIDGILTLAEFKTIYIADLDCIEKQQLDKSLWPKICAKYPNIEFWIDLGNINNQWGEFMDKSINVRPVIGSESYNNIQDLNHCIAAIRKYKPLLSIDIKDQKILGPEKLLSEMNSWPDNIIILSLSYVGSHCGPDIDSIKAIQKCTSNKTLYYGGGTRNTEDINQLRLLNIEGVLIANSLHRGIFDKNQIENIIS